MKRGLLSRTLKILLSEGHLPIAQNDDRLPIMNWGCHDQLQLKHVQKHQKLAVAAHHWLVYGHAGIWLFMAFLFVYT